MWHCSVAIHSRPGAPIIPIRGWSKSTSTETALIARRILDGVGLLTPIVGFTGSALHFRRYVTDSELEICGPVTDDRNNPAMADWAELEAQLENGWTHEQLYARACELYGMGP